MNRFANFVNGAMLLTVIFVTTSSASVSDSWIDYSREHAIPLEGRSDRDTLLPYLESANLVLMGETTHGTHDYYAWRAELSKALIEKAGFRFIALEGDWHAIDRLDRYVRHLPTESGSANAVLKTFDRWPEWMWANPVIEELAEWLHAYNADRNQEDRAGIHGIDVYGWGGSAAKLPSYLEQVVAGWGLRAEEGLAPLQRFGGDNRAYYQATIRGEPTGMAKLRKIKDELDRLQANGPDICPYVWLQATQHASLLMQAKHHLRKNVQRHPQSWNPRAENFMQTVERLRTYYGANAPGIVWAHNTHIGDARYTPMRHAGLSTMGQQARESLGEDRVFLLGFASDRGSFRAGRSWGGAGVVMDMPSAEPNTFDAWLRDSMGACAFLPMAAARKQPELMQPVGHRAIGVVHATGSNMQRNYVPSSIPRRYDGILYIRRTQALAELD